MLDPVEAGRRYDALYRRSPFEDTATCYNWVLRLAGARPQEPVLDVGCGVGGALSAIAAVGAQPWGVDVSREALVRARERQGNAILIVADGSRLPLADRSFRVILNLGTLEHLSDLEGGIREMARILRTDGTAWILLPNLFYSGAIWRSIRFGYGPDHHQPIDRFATVNEWRDLLEAGGLSVRRWWPYHKGKWWKRLLPRSLAWHFLFEARRAPPSQRIPLPPLERIRPQS